ncbi:MAG: molybdopterin-dependent oxidoreductase [Jiangellaceae bacterium]
MRTVSGAGRRTNVALLAVLAAALVSGVLAFAVGSEAAVRVVVIVHGVAGLCVVLLAPWKSVIVRRSLRRSHGWPQLASVALAVLTVVVVATGIAHAMGATGLLLGVTSMQIHVGAAVVATLLVLEHARRHRPRLRRTDVGRRSLLRAGTLTGGGVLLWSTTEATARLASLPGADRRATGSHEQGTDDPERMPVTQWFTDAVPVLDLETFRLDLHGARAVSLDVRELDPSDTVRATLDCTGGWYAEQDWSGIRLDRLLSGSVGVPSRTCSVDVISVTGYRRRLPIEDAGRLLLATHVAGRPLRAGHGAPLRLVAPGRRGFWWVKWVTRVDVVDTPWWWQPPFPLQ